MVFFLTLVRKRMFREAEVAIVATVMPDLGRSLLVLPSPVLLQDRHLGETTANAVTVGRVV